MNRACDLAKKAFEESMAELDNLSEEDYKDSTVVMQVIKDNLSLWTADLLEEEGKNIELTPSLLLVLVFFRYIYCLFQFASSVLLSSGGSSKKN